MGRWFGQQRSRGAAAATPDTQKNAAPRGSVQIRKPPVLFDKTQRIIAEIESVVGGCFLAYWTSTNGSVCQNDVVGFYELLSSLGHHQQVFLLIKSDGGDGRASLRIVHLLRQFADRVVALVPLECVSAATMLALGADEIHMGPMAHLSAIDTSLRHPLSPTDSTNSPVSVSQDALARAVRLWKEADASGLSNTHPHGAIYPHIHPLVIGEADRSSSLSIRLCSEILAYHMDDAARVQQISQTLNADYPSHSYPITIREARRIGLKVADLDAKLNTLLIELNEVYSEMAQDAITDYDELNHHDNAILNIIERCGVQVFFQRNKDLHYRKEERRWVSMNDTSGWLKVTPDGDTFRTARFHIG